MKDSPLGQERWTLVAGLLAHRLNDPEGWLGSTGWNLTPLVGLFITIIIPLIPHCARFFGIRRRVG